MLEAPPSSATKRAVLRSLLVDGSQSAKLVVEPERLGTAEEHGFPSHIAERYPQGIPLDLNPSWPLDLDLDTDPEAVKVSLSFGGVVYRCRIPWQAVTVVGVGFGGVDWEHEEEMERPESAPGETSTRRKGAEERAAHLRVVK